MKTAGDILSVLFDEGFAKKAQGYSKLFDSWADITAKNGIASAAAHSRIKDLDRGILLVEMDHPGWKQILQTKQSKFLNDFRIRFPELDISGISLMLGRSDTYDDVKAEAAVSEDSAKTETQVKEPVVVISKPIVNETVSSNIEDIKDNELKETLIRLGQTIAERERK